MRKICLYLSILLLPSLQTQAQSLPSCPSNPNYKFINCQGTYHWSDGSSYTGEWGMDQRSGYGTWRSKKGDVFFGQYNSGDRTGLGLYVWQDGLAETCIYKNGEPQRCRPSKVVTGDSKLKENFKSLPETDRIDLQLYLESVGVYDGEIDGLWGKRTAMAILAMYPILSQNYSDDAASQKLFWSTFIEKAIENKLAINFTSDKAKAFIGDVEEYASTGSTQFDFRFPILYEQVADVKKGYWTKTDQNLFFEFSTYVNNDPNFVKFHQDKEERRTRSEIELKQQLTAAMKDKWTVLKQWVDLNLLDDRASVVAAFVIENSEIDDFNEINELMKVLKDADLLLAQIGLSTSTSDFAASNASATTKFEGEPQSIDLENGISSARHRVSEDSIKAKDLLTDIEAYVKTGKANFSLEFPKVYGDVAASHTDEWTTVDSRNFAALMKYVGKYDDFMQFHFAQNSIRLNERKKQKEIIVTALSAKTLQITAWIKLNLLDPNSKIAAETVKANKVALEKGFLDELMQRQEITDRLLVKLNVASNIVLEDSEKGPYRADSIFIFGNLSGNAKHIFKDLTGSIAFDTASATVCYEDLNDKYQRLFIKNFLVEKVGVARDRVSLGNCQETDDVFASSGGAANAGSVPYFDADSFEKIAEVARSDIFAFQQELDITSDLYEKDILNGSKVGYGIVIFDATSVRICMLDVEEVGPHFRAVQEHVDLMGLYLPVGVRFDQSLDPIDAFKRIQQKTCGSVYASAKSLALLMDAAKNNKMTYDTVPLWVGESDLRRLSDEIASSVAEQAQQEQSRAATDELQLQATKSAAEKALVQQNVLRSKNEVAFAALSDSMQALLKLALDFGLAHSPLEEGYLAHYTELPFVDIVTKSSSPFDNLIEHVQKRALEKWEVSSIALGRVDYGKISFGGRELPGIIVQLEVSMKNRIVGRFETDCNIIRAAFDQDFGLWRQVETGSCSDVEGQKWRLSNAFKSEWIVTPPQ